MSYIRNILLSSAATFAPEDEGKSAAQLQRESIKVTNRDTEQEDKEVEAKDGDGEEEEVIEDKKGETEDTETKEDDKELETKDDKEEKEEVQETEAQEKDRKKQERIEKKFAKERQAKKALEAEVADLKAKLAADGKEGTLTKEDLEKEAERLANERVATRDFVNACNKLAEDATKLDKDFVKKINVVATEVAAIPPVMIGILEEFDNGGAVLNYLANNEDEYESFFDSNNNPINSGKMAAKLSKISLKLIPKPKVKEISKVPDPTTPVNGNTRSVNVLHDKMSDKDWIEQRNRDVAEKQKAGRHNLR